MSEVFTESTELTVAGGPVTVYTGGRTGPVLLLLHGAMLDTAAGVWRRVGPALAAEHRVVAVDLPRHGGSRPWRGVLDDAFFRRFLPALLDALALPPVVLIGLSMGAGIAVGAALDHPDRVRALVAAGPGGLGATRPPQLGTWAALHTPGLLRATSWALARFPRLIDASMAGQLTAGRRTADYQAIVADAAAEARAKNRHGEPALDDWQVHAYGPRAMRLDLLPALPGLEVPTLWMRGANDPLVSAEVMAAAHAATPGSRLVTVPDAGHIVPYDQPAAFTAAVTEFLAALPD